MRRLFSLTHFPNARSVQLNDHLVDRKIVIAKRPHPNIQPIECMERRYNIDQPRCGSQLHEIPSRRHAAYRFSWALHFAWAFQTDKRSTSTCPAMILFLIF